MESLTLIYIQFYWMISGLTHSPLNLVVLSVSGKAEIIILLLWLNLSG
jgi:hypothetical protein